MAVAHPLADTTSFVCCPVQGFPKMGSLGIAVKTKPGSTPLPMFSTT